MGIARNAVVGPRSLLIEDDPYGINKGIYCRKERFLLRRSQPWHRETCGRQYRHESTLRFRPLGGLLIPYLDESVFLLLKLDRLFFNQPLGL